MIFICNAQRTEYVVQIKKSKRNERQRISSI